MFNDIYSLKAVEYGIRPIPADATPTMAYVPYQNSDEMFSSSVGLSTGTMFPILSKPFIGCGGAKHDR